jgi:hypothetical protein
LRDDGVDIDLLSREKKEGALKYQEAGPKGYCVQCTRRPVNTIVKTIEGFAS